MPRLNVIVLTQTGGDLSAAMWADVPAARQQYYANAGAKSAWTGATTQDNTNIQSGSVAETVVVQRVPAGATLNQIENFLQNLWQQYQTSITNANPWLHYGSTWDGTTWTIAIGA